MTKAYKYLKFCLIAYAWVMGALWIISINDPVVLPLMKVYLALTIVVSCGSLRD
jgi:hypothetical protein